MLLGSLTGAIGGGLQSGRFGRKRSLMIDATLFIITTIALILAPNLIVVLISRFVQGHCVASSVVAMPIYTSEISQPEIRKITGVFAVICISFGGSLSMIFGKSKYSDLPNNRAANLIIFWGKNTYKTLLGPT